MLLLVAALFFDPVPRIDPQSWILGRKGVVSLIFLHSNERKPSKTQYKVVFLQLIFLASRMLLPSQAHHFTRTSQVLRNLWSNSHEARGVELRASNSTERKYDDLNYVYTYSIPAAPQETN